MRSPVVLALVWVLVNAAAFHAGWAFGGNDAGSEGFERPLRNAFYGGFIGTAQLAVLLWIPALRSRAILLWPFATAAGFALGVSLIRALEDEVVPRLPVVEHGLLYGVVIAPLVVGAQWLVVRRTITGAAPQAPPVWVAGHLAGWLLVELASGAIGYYGVRIPLIGVLLAASSLPALLLVAGVRLPVVDALWPSGQASPPSR